MKSKLITLGLTLLLILIVVGIVKKLIGWAISLAFIVGVGALIFWFVTRKKA